MKHERPSWRFEPGSRAYTNTSSAIDPFEMNRFAPLRIHSPFSSLAVVSNPAASLPDCGSVRAHAPSFSPFASGMSHACFCFSDPNNMRVVSLSDVCTLTVVRTEEDPREISSTKSANET